MKQRIGLSLMPIGVMSMLIIILLGMLASVSFAAEKASDTQVGKAKVVLIYVNNSKSTYNDEIDRKMRDTFNTALANYDVLAGTKYVDLLSKNGITDFTTAERADIIDVFKNENIDYVVYAEIQPFIRKERTTIFTYGLDMTAIVPVKIIDIKNNKYLYNGKFTEIASDSTSMLGGIGNKSVSLAALDKIIVQMNAVIETKLSLHKR